MRLTKKQLLSLIKESFLNNSQNSDNTIEKIILIECYYRMNYLKEFVRTFSFFISNLSSLVDEFAKETIIKMETLEPQLSSKDWEKVTREYNALSELKKVIIDPAIMDIYRLQKHVKSLSLQLGKFVQFLQALSSKNAVGLGIGPWFNFVDSGIFDGIADINEFIIANYSGDSSENIDILQYIIDTWDKKDFAIVHYDSEAASILSQYNNSGMNTNIMIDTLLAYMDPGEAFGELNLLRYLAYMGFHQHGLTENLKVVNNLITQETPKLIHAYTSSIEEIIFTLKEEKNIEFEQLLEIHKTEYD